MHADLSRDSWWLDNWYDEFVQEPSSDAPGLHHGEVADLIAMTGREVRPVEYSPRESTRSCR